MTRPSLFCKQLINCLATYSNSNYSCFYHQGLLHLNSHHLRLNIIQNLLDWFHLRFLFFCHFLVLFLLNFGHFPIFISFVIPQPHSSNLNFLFKAELECFIYHHFQNHQLITFQFTPIVLQLFLQAFTSLPLFLQLFFSVFSPNLQFFSCEFHQSSPLFNKFHPSNWLLIVLILIFSNHP